MRRILCRADSSVGTAKPSAKPQPEVLAKSVDVKGNDALERRPRLAEALAKAWKAKAPSWWRGSAA
jgi:hypothetical protein